MARCTTLHKPGRDFVEAAVAEERLRVFEIRPATSNGVLEQPGEMRALYAQFYPTVDIALAFIRFRISSKCQGRKS